MAKIEKDLSSPVETVLKRPRLGEKISVKVVPDRLVVNNEMGDWFSEKTPSHVTVDLRVLRLLEDGDLIRVQ